MKYFKKYDELFEGQPSYQNTPTGYKNAPVNYMTNPVGYEMEEELLDVDYKIDYASPMDTEVIITSIGVYTEYEPRFAVKIDGNVVGGTTYDIQYEDDEKVYNFDIGILEEFQGIGISKELMKKIFDDARTIGCDKIQAEVVNPQFGLYLNKIGFEMEDLGFKQMATYEL